MTANPDQPSSDPAVDESAQTLQIDLQEGFDGSSVEVLVDGREVFAASSVQTAALLGFAATFTVGVSADALETEIELRVNRESLGVERVDLHNGRFVGLSVEDDAVTVIQTVTAFGYG